MKKTITILLLTALCMTVLTSCDVGNGLVAELMGGINRADEHLYPPEDCIEEPIDPIPPVEIQTTQNSYVTTEVSTTEPPETGCDCGQCDLDISDEPWPTHSFSIFTLVAVVNGEQIVGRYFTSENSHEWNGQADVDDSISALIVRGSWRCPETKAILGYSIDGGDVVYDESFITRQLTEWTINGTAYINYCDIVIPVSELSVGSHTVTCYAHVRDMQGESTMQMIEFVINCPDTAMETATEDVTIQEPIID